MKKTLMVLAVVMLAVVLVACGVPQEKIDLAKENYAKVDALATRMESAMEEIKAIADNTTMPISSSDFEFGEVYDGLSEMREVYATEMQDIDKKSEKDIDELNAALQGEIDEGEPVIAAIEDLVSELDQMTTTYEEVEAEAMLMATMLMGVDESQVTSEMEEKVQNLMSTLEGMEMNDPFEDLDENDMTSYLDAMKNMNTLLADVLVELQDFNIWFEAALA